TYPRDSRANSTRDACELLCRLFCQATPFSVVAAMPLYTPGAPAPSYTSPSYTSWSTGRSTAAHCLRWPSLHWSTDASYSCVSRASAWADARARRVFLRLQRCRTGCARFDAPGGAPALYETQSGAHMFPRVSLCGLLMPVNVPTFLFGACHDS